MFDTWRLFFLIQEQLSSLDMEDIKKLLLRVATEKAAPTNIAEEINKLHHEKV